MWANNKKIFDDIQKLSNLEKEDLFLELLRARVINFVGLAALYTRYLEERETKNDESITRLALLLGVYCGNDHSNQGKTARRYIYESGHYTEKDGSIFGQQLFEEFKNE